MLIAVAILLVIMEIILLAIGFSSEDEYVYKPRWLKRLLGSKKASKDDI